MLRSQPGPWWAKGKLKWDSVKLGLSEGLDKGLQEGLPHSARSDATIIHKRLRCVVGVPTWELQEVPDSPGSIPLGKKIKRPNGFYSTLNQLM